MGIGETTTTSSPCKTRLFIEKMTLLPDDYREMLEKIVEDIGGKIQYLTTLDQTGNSSKKIVIEYDIKDK